MTKTRFGAVVLVMGALASFGCGGGGTAEPDSGMGDPDVGLMDEGVDDSGAPDEGVDVDSGPDLLANGAACSAPTECDSGACVDGVCCNVACDGACMACTADRTGGTDGTCAPVPSETDPDEECEADAYMIGTCDGAGACDYLANGSVCRASTGDCDVAETCSLGVCPADVLSSEGVVCRAAAGPCDVSEACNGSSGSCPTDEFEPFTAAVPACDPYTCTGFSAPCRTACALDTDCVSGRFCTNAGGSNACTLGRRIFVTSTTHNGNLGGLSGADAICQARANAGGLTGTYRAWLSSGTTSAAARIHHYGGVYFRIGANGPIRVAANWADLTNGLESVAIATDEFGVSAGSNAFAWTGTNVDGSTNTANSRCGDWTTSDGGQSGLRGWTSAGVGDWTANSNVACNASMRLYCVETTPPS